MKVTHIKSGQKREVIIELLNVDDFKYINDKKFHFNWNAERDHTIYKLRLESKKDILGLMAIKEYTTDKRIEIILLASSVENTGKNKIYDEIADNLVAFACKESVKLFAGLACVSLIPKTILRKHYIEKYGMQDGGKHVYLEGKSLFNLIKKYDL